MPKMVHFGDFLKTWSLLSNSVTRQVNFNSTKIGWKCKKSKCDILSNFQTTCCCDDEILLIFFVVRWVLLTRILTRVKLSWPSTSSEWFSLTFNVYVRLCCDDSNPQDFFLSLQKSSGHIYLSQSVLILHVRTLGHDSIFGPKIKWKVEFSDILLSISIVFCAKIHNNDLWIFLSKFPFLDKNWLLV